MADKNYSVTMPDSVIVLLNHLETLMDKGELAEDAIPVEMWNAVSMHNFSKDQRVEFLEKSLQELNDEVLPRAIRFHNIGPGYIEEAQEIVSRALLRFKSS